MVAKLKYSFVTDPLSFCKYDCFMLCGFQHQCSWLNSSGDVIPCEDRPNRGDRFTRRRIRKDLNAIYYERLRSR